MSNSDCVIDLHVFIKVFFDMFFMEAVLRGLVYLSCLVWGESGESEGAEPVNMGLCHFRLERNRVGMYRIHRKGHWLHIDANDYITFSGWFLHISVIWGNCCEAFLLRFFHGTIIIPFWFATVTTFRIADQNLDNCCFLILFRFFRYITPSKFNIDVEKYPSFLVCMLKFVGCNT